MTGGSVCNSYHIAVFDAVQLNRKHSLIPDREAMEAQQQQHMLLVKERHTTQN